jgi:hypothetical protein
MDWDYDSSFSFSFKIELVCFTTGLMDSQTTTTLFFQGHASCGKPANKVSIDEMMPNHSDPDRPIV